MSVKPTIDTENIKPSYNADGKRSGGYSVCRPGSEDPHRHEQKFHMVNLHTLDGRYTIS